jgi:hypothetical protein
VRAKGDPLKVIVRELARLCFDLHQFGKSLITQAHDVVLPETRFAQDFGDQFEARLELRRQDRDSALCARPSRSGHQLRPKSLEGISESVTIKPSGTLRQCTRRQIAKPGVGPRISFSASVDSGQYGHHREPM